MTTDLRRGIGALTLTLVALAACTRGEVRSARVHYNDGLTALATPDYAVAEKELLAAISDAGVDPELRFAACFNLASAYAGHAEQARSAQPPKPEDALGYFGQAIGWLQQALKLRPTDEDAKANLTLVEHKRSALLDELGAGERALEKRLDALIDAHRGVRDDLQQIEEQLQAAAGGGEVAPMAAELTALADRERVLLTDAGVVGDMAGAEIDGIGAKPDDQRTDDEKARLVQLQNLDQYLQDARARLGEARRKLQDRAADLALDRADAALEALKRARDQLLDPITVLRGVGADQLSAMQHTLFLAAATGAPLALAAGSGAAAPPTAPPWLTEATLTQRQGALRDRTSEVEARLQAAVGSGPAPSPDTADPKAAEQAKLLAVVGRALPHVTGAVAAMERAHTALVGSKLGAVPAEQRAALEELTAAIEQFADLRQTIDLAVAGQEALGAAVAPEAAPAGGASPAERARDVARGIAQNRGRLERLTGLLTDELATQKAALAAQAQGGDPAAGSGAAPDPAQAEAQQQQLAALDQRFAAAEALRARAVTELAAFEASLGGDAAAPRRGATPPLTPAAASAVVLATLRELQRMFFSVVEHLQELVREQGETRDRSVQAQGQDDVGRAPLLPGLQTRQTEHKSMAELIAGALAEQADAASQAGAPPPGQGQAPGPSAEDLGKAAEEVRAGSGEMQSALDGFAAALDPAASTSVDLQGSVDAQAKAIEHLVAALKLLVPPQQQQQNQDQQQQQQQQNQDQQQQNQDQQQQQQQDQQQPQDQAQGSGAAPQDQDDPSGALQRVREAEAQRRREQRERERQQAAPVDKDW